MYYIEKKRKEESDGEKKRTRKYRWRNIQNEFVIQCKSNRNRINDSEKIITLDRFVKLKLFRENLRFNTYKFKSKAGKGTVKIIVIKKGKYDHVCIWIQVSACNVNC